ncbi:chromosome segregation SMC family protein [Candidatus Omnitrophota bacterium]
MYFKKLEIIGFKSFCNKTVLHFEPGITAVVGPNGCGKSNIFDSIRWVLGEQSVKSLRGSSMEDVIFNGTDSKEPLSMAEVNLTFDNSNRFFGVDHEEVVISRRLFRSGESEYLLNKSPARLKDVLDLLLGTGIGAESYSLVEQGKIDLVLSSRPEDRRLVFDEASGITKYKSQKREATRKLEETQQNLLRVNDIITEVKRQIGSLERQANKARRYKEVYEELKAKEIALAILQKSKLLAEKDGIINQLKELEDQEMNFLDMIKEQEARISNRNTEIKELEDNIMAIKNQILELNNTAVTSNQQIGINKERIAELENNQGYLIKQSQEIKGKLSEGEDKLSKVRQEYESIKGNIEERSAALKDKEEELKQIGLNIRKSLEMISVSKQTIIDSAARISGAKNNINDILTREQTHLARKKRLALEMAKVREEMGSVDQELTARTNELEVLQGGFDQLNRKSSGLKQELQEVKSLRDTINSDIAKIDKELSSLESHKEFIQNLKAKYQDLGDSVNAVIYLDKLPEKEISGLVVKINDMQKNELKLCGEAKPIDLDLVKINNKITSIQGELNGLSEARAKKEEDIGKFSGLIESLAQELKEKEIELANKRLSHENVLSRLNRLKEEEEIATLELGEIEKEIAQTEEKLNRLRDELAEMEKDHAAAQETIANEQGNIEECNVRKEKALVAIAQMQAEVEALKRRTFSDEATLKILEDAYRRDKENLADNQARIQELKEKGEALTGGISEAQEMIKEANLEEEAQKQALKEAQGKYEAASGGIGDIVKGIESDRKAFDALKNNLHKLQMQDKDLDFNYQSIKDRMLQVYKIDLDILESRHEEIDQATLLPLIQKLKEKLDSYGNVNLVAIEEYDELKKRYDFLTEQQNDLLSAKDRLHEAILKINRTTKKMFLETFESVRKEFRNYFRLLFGGGDAQLFLTDENDPLESGIEIICRPPGKKLQNVLLLSGGEKSMSAIALIFAIFKVKPSPFCILDEIDAALDEANIDRFGRMLQEFSRDSQFIMITHNKKTISNANVMYGITMEESGVSKIVSVKLSQNKEPKKDTAPDAVPV